MSGLISRRTILAGTAATAGLSLPGVQAVAAPSRRGRVGFTLDAETLDGGEQVTALTLDTNRLGRIDPASLSTSTFTVHAKATSPIGIAAGDQIFSEYDLDRTVTGIHLDRRGNIVIELATAEGQVGGGTLGYIVSRERNVRLKLEYTLTQRQPFTVGRGRSVLIKEFEQGRLRNPEVDAFGYGGSRAGLKYRLYAPPRHRAGHGRDRDRRARPLVVWLHGGGEGGSLPDGYYDNETTLRANRGALGFATPAGQRILGEAYVVAPQCTSYWIEDGPRFAPLIRRIITDLVDRYPIDPRRIYLAGCSNGGYMTMEMTVAYPRLAAAAVPICGVVAPFGDSTTPLITDAELRGISTPTWLVASRDDDTVPPAANTVHAHDLIPGSLLSLYDTVTWNGYRFPGHWSWIYVARNDPTIDGLSVWEWMARQRRDRR